MNRMPTPGSVLLVALLALSALVALQLFGASHSPSTIAFTNEIARSGIHFIEHNGATPAKHQIETMTGGAALFDFDNDGLLDVYFLNGAALPSMTKSGPEFHNRLFHNEGNGRFTDVTARAGLQGAGYSMGVAVADYDNDGFEDVFVAGANRLQLFHNNGDGTFTDVTAAAGIRGDRLAVSAGWFDYDNDGYLDLLVVNYLDWSLTNEPVCAVNGIRAYCSPDRYRGSPNQLFHNNRDGTFTDVSAQSGIGKNIGKGMGVGFAHYDGGDFTGIFISNDTFRNFLFHNNGDGTFSETGVLQGVAYNENGKAIAGMGAVFSDLDNDGRPDVFLTGMTQDTFPLFRNAGASFTDITASSGIAAATYRLTGWSAGAYDFDNDGWKDLFTANSAIQDSSELIDHLPYQLPNLILRNERNGKFSPLELAHRATHRGAAFGDLDNDGRIDVVTNNLNSEPEIWMNRGGAGNHWLILKLEGAKSSRDGLGARIQIRAGAQAQYNEATTAVGYASASDKRVHFGLGHSEKVDEIRIAWPSGIKQRLTNVQADQIVAIKEHASQ